MLQRDSAAVLIGRPIKCAHRPFRPAHRSDRCGARTRCTAAASRHRPRHRTPNPAAASAECCSAGLQAMTHMAHQLPDLLLWVGTNRCLPQASVAADALCLDVSMLDKPTIGAGVDAKMRVACKAAGLLCAVVVRLRAKVHGGTAPMEQPDLPAVNRDHFLLQGGQPWPPGVHASCGGPPRRTAAATQERSCCWTSLQCINTQPVAVLRSCAPCAHSLVHMSVYSRV